MKKYQKEEIETESLDCKNIKSSSDKKDHVDSVFEALNDRKNSLKSLQNRILEREKIQINKTMELAFKVKGKNKLSDGLKSEINYLYTFTKELSDRLAETVTNDGNPINKPLIKFRELFLYIRYQLMKQMEENTNVKWSKKVMKESIKQKICF